MLQAFVGMMTASDFIRIVRDFHANSHTLSWEQVENLSIAEWRAKHAQLGASPWHVGCAAVARLGQWRNWARVRRAEALCDLVAPADRRIAEPLQRGERAARLRRVGGPGERQVD